MFFGLVNLTNRIDCSAIDPKWWEDVLQESHGALYQPPELLSVSLRQAAEEPSSSGLKKHVLQVLANASSAILNGESWTEPFEPFIQLRDRRSTIPADLDEDEIELLSSIASLVSRSDLQARVADVAWTYGNRSDTVMLDRAIHAYREATFTDEVWPAVGKSGWIRALELAARRGPEGRDLVKEMSDALKAEILKGQVANGFRIAEHAEVLRLHGSVDKRGHTEVMNSLFQLAEQVTGNPRLKRRLEKEALGWLGRTNQNLRDSALERIANTYIAEADARIEVDPDSGAIAECYFLEKAIATFLTITRTYRREHGFDVVIEQLRSRLRDSREASVEQMTPIRSASMDLTDLVASARVEVSGHPDRLTAISSFISLAPPLDEVSTRANAIEIVENSISHIFRSSSISSDFRKVSSNGGYSGQSSEDAVWAEMVRTVHMNAQIIGKGVLQPALEILTTEHRFDRQFFLSLCTQSPLVPEGHAMLWADGLILGLDGRLGAAISILVPQLEQAIRVVLKRNNVFTLMTDEDAVESEKSLNALLEMTESAKMFGAGMVMEMKALLTDKNGPNLRNYIAHGLFSDTVAWSYDSLYVWWFCLRFAVWPVIKMND